MTEAVLNKTGVNRYYFPGKAGREAVLKTLAYFDVFRYPLTAEEIRQFLGFCCKENELQVWLKELERQNLLFFIDGYYLLHRDPSLCERRKKGNEQAARLLEKAERIGRFLYRFPFVSAVGISGSLSKNFADEDADIDFFIITRPNRLWIARTLMHLYKKLTFLTGKQHYYCMNYYIDETALQLDDKNIFAAVEIKTLLPVCGKEIMESFFSHNEWASNYLPACHYRQPSAADPKRTWLKNLLQGLLANRAGDRLEKFFMQLTQRRWNRKEEKGKLNIKGITMGLISGKHFARSNPGSLQENVLNNYKQRVMELIRMHSNSVRVLLPL
ncbi:MAG: hypothetical protein U0U70_07665 [Chitinophagaceae bacterium]